jgi:hypothetical protein
VTDKTLHKWLVSQLIQENGALSPDRIHKNGYVFGIFQHNVRAHSKHMWAKDFIAANPEWKDGDFQLRYMANMVKQRVELYDGNTACIVLHHFAPYGEHGAYTLYRKGGCNGHQYVHTHVKQRLSLLIIE